MTLSLRLRELVGSPPPWHLEREQVVVVFADGSPPDDQFHALSPLHPILITQEAWEPGSPPRPIQPRYCPGNGQGETLLHNSLYPQEVFWQHWLSAVKSPPADAGATGLIPGLGRVQEKEGNDNQPNFLAWEIPWPSRTGGL